MKIIGMIGGMSWESSKVYYELVNKNINYEMGGFHSCECLLYSLDFEVIQRLQHEDKWTELAYLMADAAKKLEQAGAGLLVLCTNTMHLCSDTITENISIPFLHIAEATGAEISRRGIKKTALLGTKFTMEKDFYKLMLQEKFDIEVIIPGEEEMDAVHRIIYSELVHGNIRDESREVFKSVINKLKARGAEGVILGCTEIPLLINDKDVDIPTFDTTELHAEAAVQWVIQNS